MFYYSLRACVYIYITCASTFSQGPNPKLMQPLHPVEAQALQARGSLGFMGRNGEVADLNAKLTKTGKRSCCTAVLRNQR